MASAGKSPLFHLGNPRRQPVHHPVDPVLAQFQPQGLVDPLPGSELTPPIEELRRQTELQQVRQTDVAHPRAEDPFEPQPGKDLSPDLEGAFQHMLHIAQISHIHLGLFGDAALEVLRSQLHEKPLAFPQGLFFPGPGFQLGNKPGAEGPQLFELLVIAGHAKMLDDAHLVVCLPA